jgi:hypothetical protein
LALDIPPRWALGVQKADLWVKVAIRHKRRLPTGYPPFIPFALLIHRSAFCWEVAVNFFFKEKVLFLCAA